MVLIKELTRLLDEKHQRLNEGRELAPAAFDSQ
jgi:hypothetical protein